MRNNTNDMKEETVTEEVKPQRLVYLPKWCDVEGCDEFESYPSDGQCVCGMYKHHVHCPHGKIIQVG